MRITDYELDNGMDLIVILYFYFYFIFSLLFLTFTRYQGVLVQQTNVHVDALIKDRIHQILKV